MTEQDIPVDLIRIVYKDKVYNASAELMEGFYKQAEAALIVKDSADATFKQVIQDAHDDLKIPAAYFRGLFLKKYKASLQAKIDELAELRNVIEAMDNSAV